jgi:hypothetical protein
MEVVLTTELTTTPHRGAVRALARLLAGAVTASALFVGAAAPAFAAAVTVTTATGGTAIADSTGGSTGTYTALGDMRFTEDSTAQIGLGNIVIKAPAGFEWKTSSVITVAQGGTVGSSRAILLSSNLSSCTSQATSISVTPTTSTISFRVCRVSGDAGYVNIATPDVRPSAKTPLASGNIYVDDSTTSALPTVVKGTSGTNLGSLAMVAGPATGLLITGLPSPYTTQSTQTVTVTALSAAGNKATSYRGAVKFTSTDTAATLPADYTFTAADNGAHVYTNGVTLRTLGSRTVNAADKSNGSISGGVGVAVVPASASSLVVSGIAATGTAGTSRSVTVTARDTYGNTATGYTGTVHFSSTDTAAGLPADYTFVAGDAGVKTFTGGVVLKTAGTHTVTATDTAASAVTGTQSGLAVTAAALDTIVVSPSSATITAGQGQAYTTQARDAYGNSLGNVAAVYSVSPDGSCTGATCTVTTAGAHTVTATHQGKTATASLNVVAAPASSITVGGIDGSAVAGAERGATVTIKDAYGNVADGYRGTVSFSSSDGAAALPASYTFTAADNGVHTFGGIVLKTAGTWSVTVKAPGLTDGTQGSLVVTAGPVDSIAFGSAPASVTAGGSAHYAVSASDAYGNSLGDVSDAATFSISPDGSCTGADCTATKAGSHTVTATYQGKSVSASLMVGHGAPDSIAVAIDPNGILADGQATASAGATVLDAYGNPVSGATVAFATSGDVTFGPVTDNGDGTYSATITASTTGGDETITAAIGELTGSAVLHETTPVSASSVGPASRGQGANGGAYGQSVTVTGSGFVAGTATDFGPGVTTKFTTFVNATTLTAHIVVAEDATVGSRDVTVTLPDGRSAVIAGAFTVNPGPSVASAAPSAIQVGKTQVVTLTGANFDAATKVSFPSTGLAITKTVLVDDSHLSVTVSAASNATAGARDLVVTNPADQGRGTCTGCITITSGPVPPALTSLDTDILGPGALRMVAFNGTGFASGAKVTFPGSGVAPYSVAYVSPTQLNVTISVAGNAAAGLRAITITNPDGTKGSCADCFEVSAGPVVSGSSHSSLARGSATTVTLTGSGFQSGATVAISNWVTVSEVNVVSADTITMKVTVPATTATGARTITITNPDGGKSTASGQLTIS